MLNIVSYNVHECVGTDGRRDPDRIARIIQGLDADIVGLQEVDFSPRGETKSHQLDYLAAVTGLPKALPPWQIVRERRATFAATPGENAKRPPARTAWRNLVLAGDWTRTGLPATIEGAIRSGNRAADLVGGSG